jgi:hypothetical protein
VEIQQRIVRFITRLNWILFALASLVGLIVSSPDFTRGIIFGGLIVSINFHLLSRTLKNAFAPPHLSSYNVILAKYYVRFAASGFIIFVLLSGGYVDPLGLVAGLSIVVASMMLVTLYAIKKLFFEKAV